MLKPPETRGKTILELFQHYQFIRVGVGFSLASGHSYHIVLSRVWKGTTAPIHVDKDAFSHHSLPSQCSTTVFKVNLDRRRLSVKNWLTKSQNCRMRFELEGDWGPVRLSLRADEPGTKWLRGSRPPSATPVPGCGRVATLTLNVCVSGSPDMDTEMIPKFSTKDEEVDYWKSQALKYQQR